MAVAFRSKSNTTYASRTNTTITAPSGIANDDILLLILFGGLSGGYPTAPTFPTGFTSLGTAPEENEGLSFFARLFAAWKRAASEAGDYTCTHSTYSTQGVIACYSGASTGTAIDPSATALAGKPANTTNTATGLTTTAADTMLVFMGADWGDTANNLSPPTSFTERHDVAPLTYVADFIQTGTGASGDKTMTCNSQSGLPRFAWLVPIVPAAGGAADHPASKRFGGVPGMAFPGRGNVWAPYRRLIWPGHRILRPA